MNNPKLSLLVTLKSARAFIEVDRDLTIESNSNISPETLASIPGTLTDIAKPYVGLANALITNLTTEIERLESDDSVRTGPVGKGAECENCDGEGAIEYEGGDGEGWPSKPERDTCLKCRGTGSAPTPDSSAPQGEIAIRSLAWRKPGAEDVEQGHEEADYVANGIGGRYAITPTLGGEYLLWMADNGFVWKGPFDLSGAKAAAETDWQSKARAALSQGEA